MIHSGLNDLICCYLTECWLKSACAIDAVHEWLNHFLGYQNVGDGRGIATQSVGEYVSFVSILRTVKEGMVYGFIYLWAECTMWRVAKFFR
jgi:hypothetical protein